LAEIAGSQLRSCKLIELFLIIFNKMDVNDDESWPATRGSGAGGGGSALATRDAEGGADEEGVLTVFRNPSVSTSLSFLSRAPAPVRSLLHMN
jgi:hypothetical protein